MNAGKSQAMIERARKKRQEKRDSFLLSIRAIANRCAARRAERARNGIQSLIDGPAITLSLEKIR